MMPPEALLFILIVLTVVTVIGHGIWVVLAWIGRTIGGAGSKDAEIHLSCPWCEKVTTVGRGRCQWCGRTLFDRQARGIADLGAVRRKLQEWQSQGKLSPEQAKIQLLEVESERRVLLGLSPLAMTAAKPSASPARPAAAERPVAIPVAEAPVDAIVIEPPSPGSSAPRSAGAPVAPPAPSPVVPSLAAKPPQMAAAGPARGTPLRPTVPGTPAAASPARTAATAAQARPLQPSSPPARPVVEQPPRKSWRELVQSFLEEREIPAVELFGVLVSSPLIVTGAVIFVIYFWETLQEYPVLKFAAFSAATVGSMLLGLLACIRWQLKTTGRGLLGISLLLVPLSFLAVASSGGEWTVVAAELGAVALFGYLITWAGRVLVPDRPWHLAAGILAPVVAIVAVSAWPAMVSRFWGVGLLGVVTVAVFAVPLVLHRRMMARLDQPGLPALIGAFFLLGTSLFPLSLALGLAAKKAALTLGSIPISLDALAVALSLLAATTLAFSLTLSRQLEGREKLSSWRAAATAVGLTSILAMAAALVLAWPWPAILFLVALVDTAVLAWIALACRFPWSHAGAIGTGAAACLAGYHLIAGHLPWDSTITGPAMVRFIFSGASAAVLVGFSGLTAAAAVWFAKARRIDDARVYAWGTAVVAVVSVVGSAAAAWFEGGTSVPQAMFVFGVYGLACLAGNNWTRVPAVGHAGLMLLAGATLWGLDWLTPAPTPVWAAVLGLEALVLAAVGWGFEWWARTRAPAAGQVGNPSGLAAILSPGAFSRNESKQPERWIPAVYQGPVLDVADGLAALTLAVAGLILLPNLALHVRTAWPAVALVSAAVAWLIGGWVRNSFERTWAASATILLMLVHTFVYCLPGRFEQPWLDSVLLHATIGVVATLACQFELRSRNDAFRGRLHRVLVLPISQSAGLSSALALPLLLVNSWQHMLTLSLCLFWLSAIWLVVAVVNRLPALVTGAQAVMCLASVTAATAWLQQCSWSVSGKVGFDDLRTWQVYGLALAILTFLWTIARLALGRIKAAGELLNPEWPSLDRVLGGLLCVLQLFLAAGAMIPALGYELGSAPANPAAVLQQAVASPSSWLLLAGLAACCAAGACNRWRQPEMLAAWAVAGTLPWLVAASLGVNADAASVLRWATAAMLLAGAALVCLRQPIAAWARSIGIPVETAAGAPQVAQAAMLCLTLLPVLAVTLAAAGGRLGGILPQGPATGTFFHALGTKVSYLVPLFTAVAALVVLAWRESSSGYAFSAGLVVKLTAALACLLSFTAWGPEQWSILWYSLAIAAAAWAASWVTARRWIDVWRESRPDGAALLMRLELALGAVSVATVLLPGMLALLGEHSTSLAAISGAAGGWLGWLALGSIVAAAVYRQFDLRRPVPPDLAGLAGLAMIGLVACSVTNLVGPLGLSAYGNLWGLHTWMIGWAAYSMLIALATWWMAEHVRIAGAEGPPQVLIRAANVWVIAAGVPAVLLGLLAATFFDPVERLWGAAAIGLASAASATMAVWRRREAWAFISGLGVNVAASFTVTYFEGTLGDWPRFLFLVEANVIAGAAVALAWLSVRKRLYHPRQPGAWSGPLLTLQICLTAAGAVALAAPTMVLLVASPGDLPAEVLRQIGSAPGATAVLLAALAAGWYLLQVRPSEVIHVIGVSALATGALVGAGAIGWTDWYARDAWLPYHATLATWAGLGLVLLAAAASVSALVRKEAEGPASAGQGADLSFGTMLPAEPAALWHFALTLSAATAGLLWCALDPGRPYWAGGVMLAGAAGAAAAALWRRRVEDILVSALLLNLAGNVAWVAWREHDLAGLIETNVLCLTVGAVVWTLLGKLLPGRVANLDLGERTYCWAELALYLALVLMAGLAAVLVSLALAGTAHPGPMPLTWWTVLAVAGALLLRLASQSRAFSLPGLYYLGLIAAGLALDMRAESARHLVWLAGPELAGFALMAAIAYGILRLAGIVKASAPDGSSHYGVLAVQWGLVATAAAIAAATALDPSFGSLLRTQFGWLAPGRWSAPLAAAAVLPAAVVMAQSTAGSRASAWRCASLAAGALLVATIGWAWLPEPDANRLNQTVVLLVAAVAMLLTAGVGLPRLVAGENPWVESGRRSLAGFGGIAAAGLALVFVQEAMLFNPETGAPMALWAVVVVTAVMAGMIVALIAMAVARHRDPLGLSEQGRTAYVYAAEVLGGLVAIHLWLAEPKLFQLGIMEQYWMLIVIGIAFAGAGLSEWFDRLGLPVLSQPLANTAALLPLLPAVGYWIPSGVDPASPLAGSSPAVWFCGSLFYAIMATTQRSRLYSFLSLGTLAAAFCLLWQKMELGLTEHVQLYGIPIGIAILLAEQIHHRELKPSVASTMRYMALTFIYLTSSAEFLWELGEQQIWLPLGLIGLAILGILAGVFLRIRSFVIVGFTSLALVLGALVYHAAVDQHQIWVFGLAMFALGIPLLAFFMVFENRKSQILAAVNRFWNWERRDLIPSRHGDRSDK